MSKGYKTMIDDETMRDFRDLVMFCQKNFPFVPMTLWNLYGEFNNILSNGCFKHSIITEEFRTSPNSTIRICPQCSPKEFQKYKGGDFV